MNTDNLTLDQVKELTSMFAGTVRHDGLNSMINTKCIIRTNSAGVWFGEIAEKSGDEVIIKDARRLWRWQTKQSISLSSVAKYGTEHKDSKIAPSVNSVWLKAIELIPCTTAAID